MWIDNELYVLESTDDAPLTCNIWPGEKGVMKTLWDDWVGLAMNSSFMVTMTRLSKKNQQLFDEKAALKFFSEVEGLPYGMSNFIFGWIDTERDNYPPPVTEPLIAIAFSLLDRISPEYANEFYLDGVNLRLKKLGLQSCKDIYCVYSQLDSIGMTFGQLLTLPELDEFVYPNGRQMVCSTFVVAMYKAAGLFGNLADSIQAGEQTPRDSYMIDIYDHDWMAPSQCALKNNPHLCQIMGDYYLDMPGWSSIPIYPNINEACASLPVDYQRCLGLNMDDPNCRC